MDADDRAGHGARVSDASSSTGRASVRCATGDEKTIDVVVSETVDVMIRKIAGHDLAHLDQLERALGP